MYNTGHYVQSMSKSVSIQKIASYLHQSRNMWTKTKFICYFVKNFDFMKFCGDYYAIYEIKEFSLAMHHGKF